MLWPMEGAMGAGIQRRRVRSDMRGCAGAAAVLAVALLCGAPRPGAAQEFSDAFFFGDSLTDTGIFCSGLGLITGQGYAPGRCSNGDVWADVLAEALGVNLDAGEENFAKGGDTTSDLDGQIDFFEFNLLFQDADPDALYVVWLGSNDVLAMPTSPTAMQSAVNRVVNGIKRLADLGAEHFLVPNLVDVGRAWGHFDFDFPQVKGEIFTPEERARVTELSSEFNALLPPALATLSGVTVHPLDVHALLEDLFATPASFGFSPDVIDSTSGATDFGIPCLEVPACENDPQGAIADGFILFDALHPTTAAHRLIGIRAVRAVPEPAAVLAQALAIGLAAALARRGRRPGFRSGTVFRFSGEKRSPSSGERENRKTVPDRNPPRRHLP
jgi:phospholipase/lecithinase/hemolysin